MVCRRSSAQDSLCEATPDEQQQLKASSSHSFWDNHPMLPVTNPFLDDHIW
jgi:hypothetical protein